MAKQVQIRGDSAANLAGVTPVARELIADTTNKRIGLGDGSSTANAEALYCLMNKDLHKMSPIYAAAGGTADAITVTLNPAPAAYAAGMTVLVAAGANNTGAATVNVNSLGAKTIKKNGGADDLEADDIVDGGIYILMYDGTNFQITGGVGGAGGSLYDSTSTPTGVASVTFSGIPATVNRLVASIGDLSATGAVGLRSRLGDSGGIETTGYAGSYMTGTTHGSHSTYFQHINSGGNASSVLNGIVIYERVTGNQWVCSGWIAHPLASEMITFSGSKTTSAALDRLQFIADTNFDAGSITVRGYA